jgi:hypothetical protein
MQRKITSAEEICAQVQGLVDEIKEVKEDRAKVVVSPPLRQPPDKNGCNWDMYNFRNATAYGFAIRQCVDRIRSQYNLPAEG